MTLFRPATRVTDPEGREWELYAYKIRLREVGPYDADLPVEDLLGLGSGPATGVLFIVGAALWLAQLPVRLLVLLGWELPRAALRARGSDEWTIEAVTWLPHETRYTWTTTSEFRRNVLAQLEGQIARGEIPPRPTRATYIGATG